MKPKNRRDLYERLDYEIRLLENYIMQTQESIPEDRKRLFVSHIKHQCFVLANTAQMLNSVK